MPAMNFDGKIILEEKNKVSMAPDDSWSPKYSGGYGTKRHLVRSCLLSRQFIGKDGRPQFIGFCIQKGTEEEAKLGEKTNTTDPVRVVCQVDSVLGVGI